MSNLCLTWVFAHGPKETGERLVLLALADYADDNGEWCPSMAGIAAKAGMTERGARGIIRRLEAAGWLTVSVGGGRGGRSRYRLNMAETRNDKPGTTNPECRANPERHDTKPGTSRHETRNQRSAEPSGTLNTPHYSVPDGTGTDAPIEDEVEDFTKTLFDRGVAYLGRNGTSSQKARSLIGKWRKAHTDEAIFSAFKAASEQRVFDPVPWITARLNGQGRRTEAMRTTDDVVARFFADLTPEAMQ